MPVDLHIVEKWNQRMGTHGGVGACAAVLGSILVSLDTDELMTLLDLPPSLTDILRYRLADH